ncbi:MAG: 30S ribosomal protein S19e [Candidatus Woesearchaeota archaeon]
MRIHIVQPHQLIEAVAKKLEKFDELQPPEWASYVKTGQHNERPPQQEDWWHVRAASILRKVALRGPVGTNKLRGLYGGRKNRGHKPDRTRIASGNIIRTCLQQLEKAGLVKQDIVAGRKGRVLTAKGHSLLDTTTNEVASQ